MMRCDKSYERHVLVEGGQMSLSTARLGLALDVPSFARLDGKRPTKSEAPAATLVAVPVCEARTRGLTAHNPCEEGADVAQSTRGYPRSDSETRTSAVKITPVSSNSATVPTTPVVA